MPGPICLFVPCCMSLCTLVVLLTSLVPEHILAFHHPSAAERQRDPGFVEAVQSWSHQVLKTWPPAKRFTVLAVVGNGFHALVPTWMSLIEANTHLSRENVTLICLDEETTAGLRQHALECHLFHVPVNKRNFSPERSDYWVLRGHMLAHWLQNNISVLLSDVDAFWVRDPMPHLHKLAGSDIVSSTGSFPTFFSDQHGHSGCMGFIYFQATRKVVSLFIPIFLTELRKIRDDQVGLSQAFQMLGFVKQEAVAPQVKDFVSFQGKLVNASDLTVTMLSPQQYIRNCTQDLSGAVILHCWQAPKSWTVGRKKPPLQHKKHMLRYIEGHLQYILKETHSPSNNTQKQERISTDLHS